MGLGNRISCAALFIFIGCAINVFVLLGLDFIFGRANNEPISTVAILFLIEGVIGFLIGNNFGNNNDEGLKPSTTSPYVPLTKDEKNIEKHEWNCKCPECEARRKADADSHEMMWVG